MKTTNMAFGLTGGNAHMIRSISRRRDLSLVLIAAALAALLLTSCDQPAAASARTTAETGKLAITIPRVAFWIDSDGSAAKSISSRAFAYADKIVIDVLYDGKSLLSAPIESSIEPLTSSTQIEASLPVGSGFTITAEVFNLAVSETVAVTRGEAEGVTVVENETTATTVTCLPVDPIALAFDEPVTHTINAEGELWYSVDVQQGAVYYIAQNNSSFRIGLFGADGLYIDSSTGAAANYTVSTYFKYEAAYTGKLYLAIVGKENTTAASGTLYVTEQAATVEAKAITAFSFADLSATGTISGTDIAVEVPYGTDLTALVATFSTTGANVTVGGTAQTSGATANDFTDPLTYRVTAADGTSQDYRVTATEASPFTYTVSGGVAAITGLSDDWASSKLARKNALTIPESIGGYAVTSIAKEAFDSRSSLTSLAIASSVASIGNSAFYGCSGLTRLVLPSGVMNIDNLAFKACENLKTVSVLGTTPPSAGTRIFYNCGSLKYICVPKASVATYQAAAGWSTYTAMICEPSGDINLTLN